MPPTSITRFTVRHYECDAYGHLNNANYLRYMEEAAFDASAAVGYDRARYEAMGRLWLARETEIEYLRPVHYGDVLAVRTWVEDFRRVRSRRRYDFHLAPTDELIARASTDWVYLDAATQRPLAVPPEMVAAFAGDAPLPPAAPRPPFPAPPPAPPGAFTVRRRVEWRDIDSAWHVNNAAYLNFIEDCGIQVANAFGWPLARWEAEGFAVVARRHHIVYLQPAALDDELTVTTFVVDFQRATATRCFLIRQAGSGDMVAQARTLWVWLDARTSRPIRIPAQFAADFAPNIAAGEA
jgi:acyl-CoA thioester hydrolase